MSDTTSSTPSAGTTPEAQAYREPMRHAAEAPPEPTGWVGWGIFAAVMMIMLGTFHAIDGLVGIFRDDYYAVSKNGLVLHVDYTAWGWVYLIGGVIIALAGVSLLSGRMWARIVAVALAVVSAVVNLAFFAAYPWWSAIMITLDILVIWALTVHGAEMKAMR